MKVLSDILHKAGILKEGAEVYSSGGYSVLVRNATTQRLETVASSAFANIYTADGSLTGNRTVTLSGSYLDIVGSSNTTRFLANGNITAGGDISALNVSATAYVVASTFWAGVAYRNNNNGNMGMTFSGQDIIFTSGQSQSYDTIHIFGNTRNVGIGATTDAGYKLDVTGEIRGVSRVSASLGGLTNNCLYTYISNHCGSAGYIGFGFVNTTNPAPADSVFDIYQGPVAAPIANLFNIKHSLLNASYAQPQAILGITTTINQSATATGDIRGIYYNPTVTSVIGNHYAWESTSGKIKVSDLSGTGSRMVVADSSGVLSTSALPTSTNIYNSDGTLAADRTVTSDGKSLTILGGKEAVANQQIGLVIQGSATTKENVGFAINNTFTGAAFYNFWVYKNGNFYIRNTTDGKNAFLIQKDGNVQIGATSLTGTLGNNSTLNVGGGIATTAGIKIFGNISPATGNGLELYFNSNSSYVMSFDRDTSTWRGLELQAADTKFRNGGSYSGQIFSSTGNWTIGGTTDSGYKLDVQGTARVTGDALIDELKITRNGTPSANYNTYIGNSSWGSNTLQYNTIIGGAASVGTGNRNVGVGSAVTFANSGNVAIGHNAIASGSAIAIGSSTWALANTLVFGSHNHQISAVYFGTGVQRSSDNSYVSGAGTSVSINASGAFGTDQTGGDITIAGGKGTGTGTPGDVIISTATATASGTTLQSLTQRVWIKGENGNVGIGASPNAAYKLDVAGAGRFTNTLSVITTGTTNDVALFKSTEPYITVEAAGGSNSASIFLKPSTSSQNGTIQNRTGGGLEFYVNADYVNPKMTIKGTTVNISSLPTSASGLSSGDIWNDAGTLKVA